MMVTNETIKQKNWRNSWRNLRFLAIVLLCTCLLLTACTDAQIEESADIIMDILSYISDDSDANVAGDSDVNVTEDSENTVSTYGEMIVHFIDVGQADATLFIQDGHTMLFDTATASRGDDLVDYLRDLDIDYIDVLVLSHPHNDHMGGSATVLNNMEVGKIYGPDIFSISSLDTYQWFTNMIDTVDVIDFEKNQGLPEDEQTSIWHFPRNDNGEFDKFNLGDAIVEFYAPLEDEYSDLNDYSICAKVTFGTVDIFLTGDATSNVEKALISEGYDLDIEIFQASHHGSNTGNSKEFLEAMSPNDIVISCGMNNRHSHPSKSVVELYEEMGITVYRTDESGHIVLTTNGTEYSFDKQPGTYTSGSEYKAKGE